MRYFKNTSSSKNRCRYEIDWEPSIIFLLSLDVSQMLGFSRSPHTPSIWNQEDWHFLMSGVAVKKPWNIQRVSPGTHLACAATFSRAVWASCLYGDTDAFQYWYYGMTGESISLQTSTFKQNKRCSEKLSNNMRCRGKLIVHQVFSPGSDYKAEIVLQITHLSVRFSQTMLAFPSMTLRVFKVFREDLS